MKNQQRISILTKAELNTIEMLKGTQHKLSITNPIIEHLIDLGILFEMVTDTWIICEHTLEWILVDWSKDILD